MVSLARPDLCTTVLEDMSAHELRELARELRVFSDLDGTAEFAKYDDTCIGREEWLEAVNAPPVTTTQVNLCIVKPSTKALGGSYADTLLAGQPWYTGPPTDFASHAWRYSFASFVDAIESEAKERARTRAEAGLAPDPTRYYWNGE